MATTFTRGLLGLEHEAALLVEIDAADGGLGTQVD